MYIDYIPILGVILLILFLVLALTGILRKRLTHRWLLIHKYATLIALAVLVAHVIVEIPN